LNGPFGVMLHAPGLGGPLQELGAAIRFRTHMTSRVREIAILAVAAATDSAFERYAHERVGLAAGLNEAELAALRAGSFVSDNPTEAAAYALCVRLLHQPGPLGDTEYQNAEAVLGSEGILELTVLVGYYRMLAQLMNVFGIDAPSPVNSKLTHPGEAARAGRSFPAPPEIVSHRIMSFSGGCSPDG
jgi:4-carboxymuconolactone decarboxylase